MALLEFPNPVAWYEGAKDSNLKREEINAFVSMMYSAQITFLWKSGASKWAQYIGEGKAMQDAATSMYLTLSRLETKGMLTLTVPTDLLAPDNLSKFQTEQVTK